MSTQTSSERLAALPTFRESVAKGYRAAPILERLAEAERRDAFLALFANAPRKPDAIYEFQRSHCRLQLPDEKQRTLIHDGIRAGYITREQIVAYRATQLLDDLASFADTTDAADALYVAFMRESAEAVEAATYAHGIPTPQTKQNAAQQIKELVAVGSMHVARLAL
jgi:hypothetical protein